MVNEVYNAITSTHKSINALENQKVVRGCPCEQMLQLCDIFLSFHAD